MFKHTGIFLGIYFECNTLVTRLWLLFDNESYTLYPLAINTDFGISWNGRALFTVPSPTLNLNRLVPVQKVIGRSKNHQN